MGAVTAPLGTDPNLVAALLCEGTAPREIRTAWSTGASLPRPQREHAVPPGVHLVLPGDSAYPPGLLDLSDAPVLLWARGDLGALAGPSLGVSGTREPGPFGQIVTTTAVNAALAAGGVIVSGAAIGVDALAHTLALDADARTVAYLGEGITGKGGSGMADRIVAHGGAVVSEVPPGTPASGRCLVARDRLIAAHPGTVLIAAGKDGSGTAHTAAAAFRLSRPIVVALPKPGHTPADAELPVALASVPEFDGTIRGLPSSSRLFAPASEALIARARTSSPVADWVAGDRTELAGLVTAAVALC